MARTIKCIPGQSKWSCADIEAVRTSPYDTHTSAQPGAIEFPVRVDAVGHEVGPRRSEVAAPAKNRGGPLQEKYRHKYANMRVPEEVCKNTKLPVVRQPRLTDDRIGKIVICGADRHICI